MLGFALSLVPGLYGLVPENAVHFAELPADPHLQIVLGFVG